MKRKTHGSLRQENAGCRTWRSITHATILLAAHVRAARHSNLRRDLLEADHARELANLALLVFAKPHQQRHRRPDQLLHFGAVGVDVDLAARHVLAAAQLRAHHVAQRGFDRRPIFGLVGGEPQPALEAGNLAVVEQTAVARRRRRRRQLLRLVVEACRARDAARPRPISVRGGRRRLGAGCGSGIGGVAAITGLAGRSSSAGPGRPTPARRPASGLPLVSAVWTSSRLVLAARLDVCGSAGDRRS